MTGDAANYTLKSDYGPLVLHLDAVEEVSGANQAADAVPPGSNDANPNIEAEGKVVYTPCLYSYVHTW